MDTSETWLAGFLISSDTGGDDLIATGDGHKTLARPVIFDNIYESSFLPALRSLYLNSTFVWANGRGRLTLCNFKLPSFG